MSCLGRERMFEHFSRTHGTPVAILRLNYATEMRYGVLVDLARQVVRGAADRSRRWATSTSSGRATPTRWRWRRCAHAASPASSSTWRARGALACERAATRARRAAWAGRCTSPAPRRAMRCSATGARLGRPRRSARAMRRSADRLDGRLGRARRRQPRQADAFRIARRAILMRDRRHVTVRLTASRLSAVGWVIGRCGDPGASAGARGDGRLDERRQRALTRYYVAAGRGRPGGRRPHDAVRDPRPGVGLFEPVLALAREEMDRADAGRTAPLVRIGGVCGGTTQALRRSRPARVGLATTPACSASRRSRDATDDELIAHCRAVPSDSRSSASTCSRRSAAVALALRVLAALRRDRRRGGHQDRAVQPLPDARRRARGRRCRARRHRALHRQRRQHRRRPADAVPLPADGGPSNAASSAACSGTGPSGRARRGPARRCHACRARRTRVPATLLPTRRRGHRRQRRVLRRRQRLRRLHRRASTRCCAGRACSRRIWCLDPHETLEPGPGATRSTASAAPTRT